MAGREHLALRGRAAEVVDEAAARARSAGTRVPAPWLGPVPPVALAVTRAGSAASRPVTT
ncbi:MAG: hypothetical protein LC623_03185 [Halobacteriales archaeon]|nr:hypothetical protein [Halobacteriales archaeon]